jgi:hypothetical protein
MIDQSDAASPAGEPRQIANLSNEASSMALKDRSVLKARLLQASASR